jgi:hypothetical protein
VSTTDNMPWTLEVNRLWLLLDLVDACKFVTIKITITGNFYIAVSLPVISLLLDWVKEISMDDTLLLIILGGFFVVILVPLAIAARNRRKK